MMDRTEMRSRLQQVLEQYAKSPNWTPRQEIRQPSFWKTMRAEFVGSLMLMVLSCSPDTYFGPFSYGAVMTILSYSSRTANIHCNPSITVVSLLLHNITSFRCVAVILSHTIGSITGSAIVTFGLSSNSSSAVVLPIVTVPPVIGFGLEFFGSLIIIMTVAGKLERQRDDPIFPVVLGLAFACASSVARQATGGFMNPIRALAIALFRNDCWQNHHIYWLGPVFGGFIGFFTYDFIKLRDCQEANQAGLNHDPAAPRKSQLLKQDSEFTQTETTEMTIATLT